jgi:predicted MPP superfamily phosphohydrolase
MQPSRERHIFKPGHRLRHALSTRAFRWLSRNAEVSGCPTKGFQIRYETIRLQRLPTNLAGLRIAHLSDLHVGTILTPDHLPAIVEAVNQLQADLIVNTGDLMDYSNRYLTAVVEATRRMAAPLGVYTILGNHDYRDNAFEIVHAFRMADLSLLVNQHVSVKCNGHDIAIAGIDFSEDDHELHRLVNLTCRGIARDELRILLAHHPHAFEAAQRFGVDLVLAGHTHGGQFVFRDSRPHQQTSFGLGNIKWRYAQGHYHQGQTHLHVTNGLGGSFPLRFRCPAEIALLELQPV